MLIENYASPLGEIIISAHDGAICGLWFAGQKYEKRGIDKSVFLDTMEDMAIASRLPQNSGKVFGILQSVYREWLRLNLDCRIYRLGNLEFEIV